MIKLLQLRSIDECEKHEMWFKVKMMQTVNEFVAEVNRWLSCNEGCSRDEGPEDDELMSRHQGDEVQIEPCDSISNIMSNTSSKQRRSTASLQRQVEAETGCNHGMCRYTTEKACFGRASSET